MSGTLWSSQFPRRDFLRGLAAAGAAAGVGAGLVPGLAKASPRTPGSRPFPTRLPGTVNPDLTPQLANIEHFVYVMNENHSFDAYLGMLPWRVPSRKGKVDGFKALGKDGIPLVFQSDDQGNTYRSFPAPIPPSPSAEGCQISDFPRPRGPGNNQGWDGSHLEFNNGKMDSFVRYNGEAAMEYWDDQHELPFLYSLARYFPVGDRYFSSTLAPTYPNRVFSFTGSAGGTWSTDTPPPDIIPPNGRIFDVLEHYGISWADYYCDLPSAGLLGKSWAAARSGTHFFGPNPPVTDIDGMLGVLEAKMAANNLESFVLVEQVFTEGDEEPPESMLTGQYFLYRVVSLFMKYPHIWEKTMICFSYDEAGGFYDHVPPPLALGPGDGTHPNMHGGSPGHPPAKLYGDNDYTRLGFRVPNCIVSPWAKPNFVSHKVYDHGSLLATLQSKWNLPALTFRDANANDLRDFLVPNRGLSPGQAPFHDPGELNLVPEIRSLPYGDPVADSENCKNHQDVTANTFPPAQKRPKPGPKPGHKPGD